MTVDTTRLRELHAAATAGEWRMEIGYTAIYGTQFSNPGVWGGSDGVTFVSDCGTGAGCEADAAYIAAVHNALPDVLDALEQARAERDEARVLHKLVCAKFDEACAERDALAAELNSVRAQVDDFGADCYTWGLDNKTWRPDFGEWQTWKAQEAL